MEVGSKGEKWYGVRSWIYFFFRSLFLFYFSYLGLCRWEEVGGRVFFLSIGIGVFFRTNEFYLVFFVC